MSELVLNRAFADLDGLAAWYAELIATGGVAAPELPRDYAGQPVDIRVEVAGGQRFAFRGEMAQVEGTATTRVDFQPSPALRELVCLHTLQRRAGALAGNGGAHRRHHRYQTRLSVRFRSFPALIDEFVTNISQGGMFVRTRTPPPVGTQLELGITFPDGSELPVQVEVIHHISVELGEVLGTMPGVGVRFLHEPSGFHSSLQALLQAYFVRPRRVLVVDDDQFFLRVLADQLMGEGMEVATARGGKEGSRRLMDLFYELDGVVLDLVMPDLSGRTLLQRIRRLGPELRLRVVLVSSVEESSLSTLVGPQGADDAISKSRPMGEVVARIKAALTR